MTHQLSFSLPNFDEKIFLHAIDGNFDCKNSISQNEIQEEMNEVNVKFLLSLDDEENFNDTSTEGNSDGEELQKEKNLSGNNSPKANKFSDLLTVNNSKIASEMEKIRGETVKNFKTYQMGLYKKIMSMKYYLANTANSVNGFKGTSGVCNGKY